MYIIILNTGKTTHDLHVKVAVTVIRCPVASDLCITFLSCNGFLLNTFIITSLAKEVMFLVALVS